MSEPTAVSTCPRRRVLLTVSGSVPGDLAERIAAGRRPRADYVEMAAAMDAELLDRSAVERALGRPGRLIARFVGPDVMMAVVVFRRRREHDVVVTDGEQVGMPLAALLRLVPRAKAPRHIMIGHRISTRAKRLAFSLGGLRRRIDRVVLYSSAQTAVALDDLGLPLGAVVEIPFMVDAEFFRPDVVTATASARPLVGTAGLELRDYPTLVSAVDGLDVDVTVAAASPWSKRPNPLATADLPDNVRVVALDQHDLRQLYADADIVAVPLVETDFQAGITTILEAMAMGKPVVCSRSIGQTDTIVDDVTGVYVPPGDAARLREAIEALLADPERAARLGRAARQWVLDHADIDVYARRFADLVDDVGRAIVGRR